MNARIPDTHAEAWALLPWLANGRLDAAGHIDVPVPASVASPLAPKS